MTERTKLELNNTENWNELKHVISSYVISHVIYFKRDRVKRDYGQPRHSLHYFMFMAIPVTTPDSFYVKVFERRPNYGDLSDKVDPSARRSLSRSLKLTGTDTHWSATYDFLLVTHSSYDPILYRAEIKGTQLELQ